MGSAQSISSFTGKSRVVDLGWTQEYVDQDVTTFQWWATKIRYSQEKDI
jgi:hypothetical protein